MYHGIPINSETIALFFGAVVWIIRGIARAFKRAGKPGPAAPPLQAPPPSLASGPTTAPGSPASSGLQPRLPSQVPPRLQAPPPSQALPARAPRLDPPRQRERQPQAGGPAVPEEATRRDFERQEQDLFLSEPSALNTSLASAPARPAASANSLFGGTDDLVRAIILQEVLGPPLSRRAAKPGQSPTPSASSPASPQ